MVINLNYIDVSATTCFSGSSTLFPRVLGGVKDITSYADMDISSSGTIAIVGYSKSTDLISHSTDKPILIIMSPTGTY